MNLLYYLNQFLNTIFNIVHTKTCTDNTNDADIKSSVVLNVATTIAPISLREAIKQNNATVVKMLCLAGLDVTAASADNATCLNFAIDTEEIIDTNDYRVHMDHFRESKIVNPNRLSIIETLCAHGANVNAINKYGCSCLHLAVVTKELAIIKILCEYGANLNITSANGQTPIHLVISAGEGSISVSIIKMLAEHGANLDLVTKLNRTLLDFAIDLNSVIFVKLLIACGADVNVGYNGTTALHESINHWCSFNLIEHLILAGADPLAKDSRGKTVLDLLSGSLHKKLNDLVMYGASSNIKSARMVA